MKSPVLKIFIPLLAVILFMPIAQATLFYFQGYESETLTITTSTVVQCTDAKLNARGNNKTHRAYFTVENAAIRYLYDEGSAGAPTTSVGIKVSPGNSFEILGFENIKSIGMIGETGTSTVNVLYETIRTLK